MNSTLLHTTSLRSPATRTIDTVYWDFEEFLVNPESHEMVTQNGQRIKMRRKEFELFRYFYLNSARVINKQELVEKIWNYDLCITTNTLEVHLFCLRRTLKKVTDRSVIETLHGAGYRFCL